MTLKCIESYTRMPIFFFILRLRQTYYNLKNAQGIYLE